MAMTKAELMASIERELGAMWAYLNGLTDAERVEIRNPDGWSAKDHLTHITAWEDSVIDFLTGQPRYARMQVSEAVYKSHDFDAINKVIYELHRDETWEQVVRDFQSTHTELVNLLEPLTDADLVKPYTAYLADERPEAQTTAALDVIVGNTLEHYPEHVEWIKGTLASA